MARITDNHKLVMKYMKSIIDPVNKRLRKFEVKVARAFINYSSEEAPSGARERDGTRLKDMLKRLKIRKVGESRSGVTVEALLKKRKTEITLEVITNANNETVLINRVNYGTGIHKEKGLDGEYFGDAPGPIKPKEKEFLWWKDENGVWHKAKEVEGQKPKRFLEAARKRVMTDIGSKIKF